MSQQDGLKNVKAFEDWIASRYQSNDWAEYIHKGQLDRTLIAQECQMSRTAVYKNAEIVKLRKATEDDLRTQGILPSKATQKIDKKLPERDISQAKRQRDAIRLKRLEQENAALRAENTKLKSKLSEYDLLEDVFAETGRVPRPCKLRL